MGAVVTLEEETDSRGSPTRCSCAVVQLQGVVGSATGSEDGEGVEAGGRGATATAAMQLEASPADVHLDLEPRRLQMNTRL